MSTSKRNVMPSRPLGLALLILLVSAGPTLAQTFTVINTRNSGGGSLRRAITRANASPGSTIAFAIPTTDPRYDPATGVFTIRINRTLPALTGAGTLLDGTTQTVNIGDTNPGTLGTGGTVGVDDLLLPGVPAPEIQIVDNSGLFIGLDIQASNVTVRGLAIHGFGVVPNSDDSANVRVQNVAGTVIERCVIGTEAHTFTDPGKTPRSGGDNVRVVSGDNGVLRDNLIGYAPGKGLELKGGANGWLVQGNEIRRNGIGNPTLDAIDIESGSQGATIRGNLLAQSDAVGIDSYQSAGSNRIENNTIESNGIGSGVDLETPGIRVYGSGNTVDHNIVRFNAGAGVLVTSGSSGNVITRNSIFGNGPSTGQIGIDLLAPGDDSSLGTSPYVTPNDSGDGDGGGGNGLLNFPVLLDAKLGSGQLTLTGYARPGSAIELFLAAPDPSGFGEGQTYLTTLVEGSGADLDSTSGTYTSPVNGLNVGTDTTDRFRFVIPIPAGVAMGTTLTATATVGGNTSEFSGNIAISSGPELTLTMAVLPAGPQNPGAELTYTITFENEGGLDAHDVVILDPTPNDTDFKLASAFENLGTTGLTVTVEYSDDGGTGWGYVPVSGQGGAPAGFDRTVTHVRWVFTGTLSPAPPDNLGSVGYTARIR
jgi:uncharacterized repeat protein (TIGR01451 family)